MRCYRTSAPSATPKLPAFARVRPWTKSLRPHPLTTRLSRFRGGFAPSATKAHPLAHNIYQARAQLTVDTLSSAPFDMSLSSDGTILALAMGGGWKGRDPLLHYYLLGDQSTDFLEGASIDPGLSSVPRYVTTDESRKLVFLADDDCVKSFSFAPDNAGKVPKRLPNVHTLASQGHFDGPLVVLPNGRLARAGTGQAAVWDLTAPGTHSTVAFADDPTYFPAAWQLHEPSGHLLCAEGAEESGGYACMSLDLEHGGRRVARYLGHGGEVEKIATSPQDPHVFITAGSDGYARLFDVRRPLPVLTFNTGLQREGCTDVVLVHPDGIPSEHCLFHLVCFYGGLMSHYQHCSPGATSPSRSRCGTYAQRSAYTSSQREPTPSQDLRGTPRAQHSMSRPSAGTSTA